jgi:HK97 family phage major capsid protein
MPVIVDTDLRKAGMERLRKIVGELDNITVNGFKSEDGNIVVSTEVKSDFDKLIAEQKGIRSTLAGFDEAKALEAWLDAPATETKSVAQVVPGMPLTQNKSIGALFLESDSYKTRDRSSGLTREDFELKAHLLAQGLERKDIYTAAGGTFTNFAFGTPQIEPIVPRAYRTQRVRDLFPVATTSANLIEYLRVLGYVDGTNNAAPVPERDTGSPQNFGLKPHTSLQLQPAQSPIRTIAHYEVAHRNTLNDEPQLQSIIDTELLYGLRLAEDAQLLNGDGTGENILGILMTPGVQRYPGTPIPTPTPVLAGDTYVDAIRRAATRIMLAYYEPTGIVTHPFDWENMETIKDSLGQYIVAINVAIGAQKQLWQMPVVASPAMSQGTSLVGAFGLGAKVYDREQANIRVAEQHADLFTRNAVAILAEERIGLTVSRPESFIVVDLTHSTAPLA